MLRRRLKPLPPGPEAIAPRRRRRTILIFVAGVTAALLLLVAIFLAAWLRRYPPIDTRWARVPDAVALVHLDGSGEGEALLRTPLKGLHRRKLAGSIDFDSFWSSFQFMLHPVATVWVIPKDTADPPDPQSGMNWVVALSLKRRHPFLERQLNRVLGKAGAQPPNGSESEEPDSRHRRGGLFGAERNGALVLGSVSETTREVLDALALAAGTGAGEPSAESIDSVWAELTGSTPITIAIRTPAKWAAPVVGEWVGKDWRPVFDALWPASPALFADAEWLTGTGTLSAPDTLDLVLEWERADGDDNRRLQRSAVNQWVSNINKAFQDASLDGMEAAVLEPKPDERVSVRLRITHWQRFF